VWTNNIGEKEGQRRLTQSIKDYHWNGINTVGEVLGISTRRSVDELERSGAVFRHLVFRNFKFR